MGVSLEGIPPKAAKKKFSKNDPMFNDARRNKKKLKNSTEKIMIEEPEGGAVAETETKLSKKKMKKNKSFIIAEENTETGTVEDTTSSIPSPKKKKRKKNKKLPANIETTDTKTETEEPELINQVINNTSKNKSSCSASLSPFESALKKTNKKLRKKKKSVNDNLTNEKIESSEPSIEDNNLDSSEANQKSQKRKITNNVEEETVSKKKKKSKLKQSISDENEKNVTCDANSDKNLSMKKKLLKNRSSSDETENVNDASASESVDNGNQVSRDLRTIFVGNVPMDFKKKKLLGLFKKIGSVEKMWTRGIKPVSDNISKKTALLGKLLPKEHPPLVVHILFKTVDDANRAVALNGTIFEEHRLRITLSRCKRFDEGKGVFVGNLDLKITEEELFDMFSKCGNIISSRIIRDPRTGLGKGVGYVNFDSVDAVELALKLNDEKLNNREIRVKRLLSDRKMKKIAKRKETQKMKENIHNKKTKNNKSKNEISAEASSNKFPKGTKDKFSAKQSSGKFQKKKKSNISELKKKMLAKKLTTPSKKKEKKSE